MLFDSLNACELCGTWFTDDSHKEDHLNSCPKLPIFDEIGSSEDEPSSKHNCFYAPSQWSSYANIYHRFVTQFAGSFRV